MFLLGFPFFFFNPSGGNAETDGPGNPASFPGRSGHACVVFHDRLFVIGGFDGLHALSDVWASTNGKDFTLLTRRAAFPPRALFSACVFRDRLFVTGGFTLDPVKNVTVLSDVWSSRDGQTWVRESSRAFPGGLGGHASYSYAGKIWTAGGISPSARIYSSTNGRSWILAEKDADFGRRGLLSAAVWDGAVWMAGGYTLDDKNNFRECPDIWKSADGVNWMCVRKRIPSFGGGTQALLAQGGELFLVGGVGGRESIRRSRDGKTWRSREIGSGFGERLAAAVVVYRGNLVITGGYDGRDHTGETWTLPGEKAVR